MQRIVIIGCGGAGKSTLAQELGKRTGLPVIHLDSIFWLPGWVEMNRDEFDRKIRAELEKEQWIIDGNYNRTMPERVARCDTIIYLDFPRIVCLYGIFKRLLTNIGKTRPDMGEGCPERIDWEFLKWVWNYNKDKRERNYRLLNEATHAETIVLKNRRAVKKFLKSL
jgi:adenylate kinase family enzyme